MQGKSLYPEKAESAIGGRSSNSSREMTKRGVSLVRDQYELTAIVFSDEDQYTALCLDFDIAASGRTEKAALDEMMRLVIVFLDYAEREGMRDFSRPVPVEAIHAIVSEHTRPSPDHPVRRKAEVVGFVPVHA